LRDEVIAMRRRLHAYPELGFEEFVTANLITARLEQLGFEVHGGIATTGVVGLMRGTKPGRTVMLRSSHEMPVDAIPQRLEPSSLNDYLEVMTRAVFQAGLSWSMIAKRWGGFREAFADFDVQRVATFDEGDIDRLSRDPTILRSSKKIRATVANARALIELDRRHGGIRSYLRSFGNYLSLVKDFRKRFKFMGDMNVWYFLFCVNEPVPAFEEWLPSIPGDHPRMKEMVQRARSQGTY